MSGNWTNYIEEGSRDWIARTTTDTGNPGSRIAQISAYNSGDASTVSWLITPQIDLDAQEFEFFDFESSNSFSDGSELELLISTDWDGTDASVSSATWTSLPGTIVPDATYYKDWIYSGLVDLSPYSGNAHIAFKYTANSGNTGTYEIDNVKVLVQN
ncbi:MAG: choice-of-anchor J domain-containing protein [Flavobacteriaceae bacterium]